MPAAVLVYRSVGNTAQAGTGIANRSAKASNTPASTKGNTPTVAGHGGSKVLPQSPTGLYYIHTDHLGTPRVITDPSTGQVVWRWDGEPFGASAPNEDPNGSGANFVFNLRFPGQYYFAELNDQPPPMSMNESIAMPNAEGTALIYQPIMDAVEQMETLQQIEEESQLPTEAQRLNPSTIEPTGSK